MAARKSILVVPSQTYTAFEKKCQEFAGRTPAVLEDTAQYNRTREVLFHRACVLSWFGTKNRVFTVSGLQQTVESSAMLTSVLRFGNVVPDPFDQACALLLARAFPELYLQADRLPVLARLVPNDTFEVMQTNLVAVSNAISFASYNRTIVTGGAALMQEVQRLGVTLNLIPDEAYERAAVKNAVTEIQGYPPLVEVITRIAEIPRPQQDN